MHEYAKTNMNDNFFMVFCNSKNEYCFSVKNENFGLTIVCLCVCLILYPLHWEHCIPMNQTFSPVPALQPRHVRFFLVQD